MILSGWSLRTYLAKSWRICSNPAGTGYFWRYLLAISYTIAGKIIIKWKNSRGSWSDEKERHCRQYRLIHQYTATKSLLAVWAHLVRSIYIMGRSIRFAAYGMYYIFIKMLPQDSRTARNVDSTYLELLGSLVSTLINRLILFYKRQPDD